MADWGTIPQWFSAAAACGGLAVAIIASRSWQKTLKEKRGDELLVAILDFAGEVGATRAAIKRMASPDMNNGPEIYGARMDRFHASLLGLQKSYVVATRSYDLEEQKLVDLRAFAERTADVSKILRERRVLVAEHTKAEGAFQNLQREVEEFRRVVRTKLPPIKGTRRFF